MTLYLTYDNEGLMDGYGAQTLRIIGIFSIAKLTHSKYIHSPIKETVEEFAHNVDGLDQLNILTTRVNEFFSLPSDSKPDSFDLVIPIRSLSVKIFLKLLFKYKFSTKKVLLRVLLPYACTEKLPSVNKIATRHIRRNNSLLFKANACNEIVVHVRLGYGQKTEKPQLARPRFLPIDYYIDVLQLLSLNFSRKGIRKLVLIHTDLAPQAKIWNPTPKALNEVIYLGETATQGSIQVAGNNISPHFQTLEGYDFQFRYCSDFIETFLDLACAKQLIMGRSAFSYLAALFNEGTVIWPDSHGHAKLHSWKSASEIGLATTYKLIPG